MARTASRTSSILKQNQDILLDKALPSNLEAECTVLASILVDNNLCYQAIELLKPEDFYRDSHRRIYDKMRELSEHGMPIDPVTLQTALSRSGELEQVGGITFISSLLDSSAYTSNLEPYARLIKGQSLLRQLITACQRGIIASFEQNDEPDAIIDEVEREIFEVGEERVRTGFTPVADIAHLQLKKLEDAASRPEMLTGLPTGFIEFDRLTNGLQHSDLIIVAARPSAGKTAFCLKIAQEVAIRHDKSVGIFSLEMSKEALVTRMLCSEAYVDAQRLRGGFLNKAEWKQLGEALQSLAISKIFIDDSPGITVMEMKAKARRLKAQHGLSLLIVDYLQLLRGRGRTESRQAEVSQISRDLKGLAKELDVPLIALSQLSRASETRGDHRPMLSDLRESGSIEQDADLVAFIFREEMYTPTEENNGVAELIVSKQRNGPTGTIPLVFIKAFTRFENPWKED